MSDQRKYRRIAVCMTVEVTTADGETRVLTTRDLSDGGVFLEGDDAHCLNLGEDLMLKVSVALQGDEAPVVKARVVRETAEGVGVCFISSPGDESENDQQDD